MADRTRAAQPAGDSAQASGDREELLREIQRRDEEISRLRELLLAKEAELGQALGRLREMEDVFRAMTGIAARVPGARRVTAGGLRRLGRWRREKHGG